MKLPVSGTVSLTTLGWLSPSGISRDCSLYGMVTFADVLHVLFLTLLCFCSSALTPLRSLCLQAFAFRPLLFVCFLSLSLCFKGRASLGCPFTANLMSFFCISSNISPAIVQYPIALVSSGFVVHISPC